MNRAPSSIWWRFLCWITGGNVSKSEVAHQAIDDEIATTVADLNEETERTVVGAVKPSSRKTHGLRII